MVSEKRLLDGPGSLILGGWRQAHPKIVCGVAEVQTVEPITYMEIPAFNLTPSLTST